MLKYIMFILQNFLLCLIHINDYSITCEPIRVYWHVFYCTYGMCFLTIFNNHFYHVWTDIVYIVVNNNIQYNVNRFMRYMFVAYVPDIIWHMLWYSYRHLIEMLRLHALWTLYYKKSRNYFYFEFLHYTLWPL